MFKNRANALIEIIKRETAWDQQVVETSLGTFSVLLEERTVSTNRAIEKGIPSDRITNEAGLFFLYSDIPLEHCYINYSDTVHEIIASERFTSKTGVFHHIEATFA